MYKCRWNYDDWLIKNGGDVVGGGVVVLEDDMMLWKMII